ncbi:MAG TPA: hypothetical protein VII25_02000, partial [Candidatus Acidoferrum sp.]
AQGKATWILNYSWDGDKGIDAREAMKNLAMSQAMVGANFWDAPGHSMSGSNDLPTRTAIFEWIASHEKVFYAPREPMNPVGVYFSPKSRDYNAKEFLESYRGTLLALLQAHREFQVVTPHTLATFKGRDLILPNVTVLSPKENASLQSLSANGVQLLALGATSPEISPALKLGRFKDDPAKLYLSGLQSDFAIGSGQPPKALLDALNAKAEINVEAPPSVAANFGKVSGQPRLFLANFTGLEPAKNAIPSPVSGIRVSVPTSMGDTLVYLSFLGGQQSVHGTKQDDRFVFILPALERGAAVSFGIKQ